MLGDKIDAMCKASGISISKLEAELGIGNGTIKRWNESDPRVNNLKAVADHFGVTVDDLLKEESDDSTD